MEAQQTQPAIAGVYYLTGQMEMASGFKLNTDSTFEFFFSYGALDRYGKGKWEVKDKEIILNSTSKFTKDFALLQSKTVADNDSITITIATENEMIPRNFYAQIGTEEKMIGEPTDSKGMIKFSKREFDTIKLMFEFSAERESVFTITDKTANYFEFKLLPTVWEVFFTDFHLEYSKDELTGEHPMLERKRYSYEKQ